ncbi:MAG TPA: hypothetical protein P5076_23840, partial [Myxococcota bacterium]|nr:hypothetical protein [Myxococcota bacterium]
PGPRAGPAGQRLLGEWPAQAARVRLSGHKEPVRAVLARLAAASRLNFVLADEVQGELTTSLEEVPWTEALGALLAAKDLVAVREGNVVWVLRREDHAREAGLSP